MIHATLRLSSHLSLPAHISLDALSRLLPAARHTASIHALADRTRRNSRLHPSRIRLAATVDGQRIHLIYDREGHVFVTAFPADPNYCGKRPPEISELF